VSLGNDGGRKVPISVGGETFFAHPSVLTSRSSFFQQPRHHVAWHRARRFSRPDEEELTIESLHRLIVVADMLRMDKINGLFVPASHLNFSVKKLRSQK
jgi:hypothetical protein